MPTPAVSTSTTRAKPTKEQLNAAIRRLAGISRTKAVNRLGRHNVSCTEELPREEWQTVIDEAEAEIRSRTANHFAG
jgi:hypothetical protein